MSGIKSKFFAVVIGSLGIVFFLCLLEHDRIPPPSLPVFVINDPFKIPTEFYSSPHAYQLLQEGKNLAKMPLERARELKIPMAKESKEDFSCFHNTISWWLIDNNLWPNSCRWNSKGEWQNSQWPRWLEVPLKMFGFFR